MPSTKDLNGYVDQDMQRVKDLESLKRAVEELLHQQASEIQELRQRVKRIEERLR